MKKLAAVLVIVNEKILMVLNQKHIGKNKYTIPKGKIKKGEDSLKAAKREFKEETGMNLSGLQPIDFMLYNTGSKLVYVYIYPKISGKKFTSLKNNANPMDKEIAKMKLFKKEKAINNSHEGYKKLIKELFKKYI